MVFPGLEVWDRAGRQRLEEVIGDPAAVGHIVGGVGGSESLGALPGEVDFVETLVWGPGSVQGVLVDGR